MADSPRTKLGLPNDGINPNEKKKTTPHKKLKKTVRKKTRARIKKANPKLKGKALKTRVRRQTTTAVTRTKARESGKETFADQKAAGEKRQAAQLRMYGYM